jgi:hypothetical protein
MKKLIVLMFLMSVTLMSYGQLLAPKGIKIGNYRAVGTSVITVDSIVQLSTNQFRLYKGATLLNAVNILKLDIADTATMLTPAYTRINAKVDTAGMVNISNIILLATPDSVQHTAAYTVGAGDVFKDQMCLKTTSMAITLPANLTEWPVGAWMNFLQEGAGILVFKKAGGVRFVTPLDSIATATKGDMVSVKKIGVSAYMLTDMTK